MVPIGRIIRIGLYRILEQRRRHRISIIVVVGPSESVRRIGEIGKAFSAPSEPVLRPPLGFRHVRAGDTQDCWKRAGCRIDGQDFLIDRLRLLPVAHLFVQLRRASLAAACRAEKVGWRFDKEKWLYPVGRSLPRVGPGEPWPARLFLSSSRALFSESCACWGCFAWS